MQRFTPLFVLIFILVSVDEVFAQNIQIKQPTNGGFQVGSRTGSDIAQTLVNNTITIIFSIASLGVLIMMLWGAVDWIFSAGDKEKIKSAQKKITTAIIGAVVLALTFFIARVLGDIIGINFTGAFTLPKLL